ncbi:MAG: hypothetical protein N2559_04200 [Anaerolineae bacterium]|nr:hypothetical protein [Anaerolineae bacterium]
MADPLEQFLTEYVDAVGGLVEQLEPQVYDVLLPDVAIPQRIVLDPDALPEHPSAQLLTFGSTLLDDWLAHARARGQIGWMFLDDVHLTPHALAQRITREITLPEQITLRIENTRPLYVTHSIFWFEATFFGEEKEQALYPLALDRYYNRQVRYLDEWLEGERLAETRRWAFADAPAVPLAQAYLAARDAVTRTVRAEAHARQQDAHTRLALQTERMKRYYADVRAELEERIAKAQARGDEVTSLRARVETLNREERVRLEELARRAQVRVELQLVNLLHIKIPRLFLYTRPVAKQSQVLRPASLTLTWDPLIEKTDALVCPNCQRPTFALRVNRHGVLHCPECEPTR